MPKIIRQFDKTEVLNFSGYEYQVNAVDLLLDAEYGACFFEQGLGKTKVAIDIVVNWLNKKTCDTVIIFTKKHLVKNWIDEFKLHSSISPSVLAQNTRDNYYLFNSSVKVLIAHYEVANKELERIKLFGKARDINTILDESQKLKNPNSKITKTFYEIRTAFKQRIILTGTPAANRPYDIWSQIFFLDGGKALGCDFTEFKSETDISKANLAENNKTNYTQKLDSVFNKIKHFCIRETKLNCGIELPGKSIINILCEAEPEQNRIYNRAKKELLIIRNDFKNLTEENLDNVLKRLLRLVQISSNPILITKDYDRVPGKVQELLTLIEIIKSKKEKVIVWTNFIENCGQLKKYLKNMTPVLYHGRMTYENRQISLDKFKFKEEVKCLIATPASAKEGLTLTHANNTIFFDRGFSLDDYLQAQDRVHRISQKKHVKIYNLIMENTVDEWVNELLNLKEAASRFTIGDLSSEEFNKNSNVNVNELLNCILNDEV